MVYVVTSLIKVYNCVRGFWLGSTWLSKYSLLFPLGYICVVSFTVPLLYVGTYLSYIAYQSNIFKELALGLSLILGDSSFPSCILLCVHRFFS